MKPAGMAPRARIEAAGEPGVYAVAGELTFASVPAVWKEGEKLAAGGEAMTLDLAGVSRADSAGLALLVEWMRAAARRGAAMSFRNVPEQMKAMARTSGLHRVLMLEGDPDGA